MENIIKTFMRVQRHLDDADVLIARYPELERLALSDPAALSDQDRRRLLDIPDRDTENANLAAATELTKAQLLERAATSCDALTDAEIGLLLERYWRDVTDAEGRAASVAREALDPGAHAYSRGQWEALADQLARARAPLYEENELEALQNAPKEWTWRITADSRAREAAEMERAMRNAAPWIQRLWIEDLQDRPEVRWGYAVFYDPAIKAEMGEERYDDYLARADGVLQWAQWAIRCGSVIESRFSQQRLEWPADLAAAAEKQPNLVATFQKLREAFKSARAAPKKHVWQPGPGINDNLLQNVFLVIDRDAANSHLSKWKPTCVKEAQPGRPALFTVPGAGVDDAWVWAVDPDFEPDDGASLSDKGEDGKSERYQGYLRVRMQQLVKNFYEARRWHAEKLPMRALWEAAQMSKNQLFVSIHEDEAKQWKLSMDTGSALTTNHNMVA
ncbi:hypothetical protein BJ166DRAFT_590705 [Pestalotiopsis sp. NC0098]|nr:hypothetical protein BJ166DRAFT_590705 [Pestalotiopsis sp. NC0098]